MPISAGDGQVGHDRDGRSQQANQQLDRVAVLLAGSAQHTGQDLPGAGAGAVAPVVRRATRRQQV